MRVYMIQEYDQNEYAICLGISSERKYCLGLKVEATVDTVSSLRMHREISMFLILKKYTRPCDRPCTKRPPSIKRPVFKVSIFRSYKRWNAGANII